MSFSESPVTKIQWHLHVDTAKAAWDRLTEAELLKSEGHEEKLAGLVQERYAITQEEAEKQAQRFLKKVRLMLQM